MADDQPSEQTATTLEMNPSENQMLGIDELSGQKTIQGIGSDDYVVLTNLFDGKEGRPRHELILKYGNVPHRWAPGQTVNLPGYKGRHFLLHLVKMLYMRVDKKPEMDKRDYPLTDKWVAKALVKIQPMMSSETPTDEIQTLPDYIAGDENLSQVVGTGAQELPEVQMDNDFATDESEARLESDPNLNMTPTTISQHKAATEAGQGGDGSGNPPAPAGEGDGDGSGNDTSGGANHNQGGQPARQAGRLPILP